LALQPRLLRPASAWLALAEPQHEKDAVLRSVQQLWQQHGEAQAQLGTALAELDFSEFVAACHRLNLFCILFALAFFLPYIYFTYSCIISPGVIILHMTGLLQESLEMPRDAKGTFLSAIPQNPNCCDVSNPAELRQGADLASELLAAHHQALQQNAQNWCQEQDTRAL